MFVYDARCEVYGAWFATSELDRYIREGTVCCITSERPQFCAIALIPP